jgi:hypothetical protein
MIRRPTVEGSPHSVEDDLGHEATEFAHPDAIVAVVLHEPGEVPAAPPDSGPDTGLLGAVPPPPAEPGP